MAPHKGGRRLPAKKEIRNRMRKIKNSIFAIPTAAPASPVKPRIPAISAKTRKTIVHPSIFLTSFYELLLTSFQMRNDSDFAHIPEKASLEK
jgi:hypothetical protein